MKRIQLFEFEDQSWFPSVIREGMTNLLNVLLRMIGLKEIVADKVKVLLDQHQEKKLVDLGSGSGGIMPEVFHELKMENEELSLTLTDLNPSKKVISRLSSIEGVQYDPESRNATDLKNAPQGVKTMINCFHHMPVEAAKAILRSATENKEILLIYEMAENKIPLVLWILFLPLGLAMVLVMAVFMTFAVRPLSLSQLFFTFILPVIPICYAWDGQASLPRIYAEKDLEELTKDLNSESYNWSYEPVVKANGKQYGYFFIGSPKIIE